MAINYETQAYTLIGMAAKFQDFFNSDPKDVEIKYKDKDGNIKTKTVPNIAKLKQELNDHGITDDDLNNKLAEYAKVGENLVFNFGPPNPSIFDNNPNTIYIDKNTATIYTKNKDGKIINNYNAEDLENTLLDYMKIGRDVVFGDGEPDNNIPDTAKLYINNTEGKFYIKNSEGVFKTVTSSGSGGSSSGDNSGGSGGSSSGDNSGGSGGSSGGKTATPVISGPNNVLETNTATYTIEDFDRNRKTLYNVTVTLGSVSITNNKIIYTPENVNSDTNVTMKVIASDAGKTASDPASITIKVSDVPDTSDQTLINNDYRNNESYNDGWEYE